MLKQTKIKLTRIVTVVAVLAILTGVFGGPGVALAAAKKSNKSTSSSSSSSSSSQVSNPPTVQGYASASALQTGTIVQLTSPGANSVTPASKAHAGLMYGVTVDPNALPFTVSNSGLQNEQYVATSGTYDVLVSTEAGPIKDGDYVTISSIDGVAMDAGTAKTTVFGRAAAPFDGKSGAIGTEQLKESNGSNGSTVTLGSIPVAIQIETNPEKQSTKVNLPKLFQAVGLQVAQKPVGPLRTYLSIAIMLVSIIIAVVVLYSGVRNSVISLGRNPLSKGHIFRGLFVIIMTSIIVLIIGFFAVYLLLKL